MHCSPYFLGKKKNQIYKRYTGGLVNSKALYRREGDLYKGGSLLFFSGHSECGICINAIFATVSNVCIKQLMFLKEVSQNIAPSEVIVNAKASHAKISATTGFRAVLSFGEGSSPPVSEEIFEQISVNRAKV